MFRKAFALAAAALCASAASANYIKVVNLASLVSDSSMTPPYENVLTLQPKTVYDLHAEDGIHAYLAVQCPAAKDVRAKANAKFSGEKAFVTYFTVSADDDNSTLRLYDNKKGITLADLTASPEEGAGSQITLVCVNGRLTAAFNERWD